MRVLGDDGGATCADPNDALTRAILLSQLANGAAGPGARPVIADSRVVQGQLLIIQVYCPDELEDFKQFVEDLKTDDVLRRADHGPARTASPSSCRRPGRSSPSSSPSSRWPTPRQFPPEECERAAQWVLDTFARARLRRRRTSRRPRTAARPSSGRRPCADPDAPTVLLYAHYDVQPPLDEEAWRTPPFELTEVDGRWYGRGTADCKGNIVMHLTALRALGDDVPVHLKLVVEGSEEQGTGGLEEFVPEPRRPAARRRDPGLRHRQRRRRRARGHGQPAREW